MVGQRRIRLPTMKTTLDKLVVFAGCCMIRADMVSHTLIRTTVVQKQDSELPALSTKIIRLTILFYKRLLLRLNNDALKSISYHFPLSEDAIMEPR